MEPLYFLGLSLGLNSVYLTTIPNGSVQYWGHEATATEQDALIWFTNGFINFQIVFAFTVYLAKDDKPLLRRVVIAAMMVHLGTLYHMSSAGNQEVGGDQGVFVKSEHIQACVFNFVMFFIGSASLRSGEMSPPGRSPFAQTCAAGWVLTIFSFIYIFYWLDVAVLSGTAKYSKEGFDVHTKFSRDANNWFTDNILHTVVMTTIGISYFGAAQQKVLMIAGAATDCVSLYFMYGTPSGDHIKPDALQEITIVNVAFLLMHLAGFAMTTVENPKKAK
jgi:hypothetical protein